MKEHNGVRTWPTKKLQQIPCVKKSRNNLTLIDEGDVSIVISPDTPQRFYRSKKKENYIWLIGPCRFVMKFQISNY